MLSRAGEGKESRKRGAFRELCTALGISDLSETLDLEMAGLHPEELPFTSVTFGYGTDAHTDVQLPPDAAGHSFTVYQSASDIWVRNTSEQSLWGRGHTLEKGEFIRIIEQQDIAVPGWRLGYDDLSFFLSARDDEQPRALYLGDDQGQLIVSRHKSRLHALKFELGLNARLTRLDRTVLDLQPPHVGFGENETKVTYHSTLKVGDAPAVSLEKLRRNSQQAGDEFSLRADSRDFLIGNKSSGLGPNDLFITPGLAPPVVLHITSDTEQGTGRLNILKANAPITLNGVPIRNNAELKDGDLVRLSKAQAIRCRFSEGIIHEERTIVRDLNLTDLSHHFKKGVPAFEDLTLKLERGEMMAIIGPSGCGKSSLLSALAGHLKPSSGEILINGKSLYKQRERFLPFISQMGQEESLSPNLTVREHLRHAFTIHRPHLPKIERSRRIDSVLNELNLQRLSQRKVGEQGDKSLSGGERGRLNLGLDLGSSAEIFLFDEPTSGLSSKDSEHLAQTLRSLALDKLVICSLHRPGSSVLDLFDKVLLLDIGGKMAFFGTPDEMVSYFEKAAEELNVTVSPRSSDPHTADFVFDILEAPLLTGGVAIRNTSRRFPGVFWQERFESQLLLREVNTVKKPSQHSDPSQPGTAAELPRQRRLGLRENLSLLRIHIERAFLSKFRSRGTIWSIAAETPLIALLIGLTLRASPGTAYQFETALHIPIFLFLTVTVGMFLGLTNSATEILRDSPQLRRERNTRRSTLSYVLAKFSTLTLLASLQCLVFLLISQALLEIDGMFWSHWIYMTLTACVGTAMALAISASVRSERAALNAVPLLLVPQILLAGALVPFDEMNRGLFQGGGRARDEGAEPVPARIMPLRYAFEGLIVSQATHNRFESLRRELQEELEVLKQKDPLSTQEENRFELLKIALIRISVAEADDSSSAKKVLREIKKLVLADDLLALEKFDPYQYSSSEDARPASAFFMNERVDKLFSQAEAYRQDYRSTTNNNHVFMAKKKVWFGIPINTSLASITILLALTIALLALTSRLIRMRYINKIR